MMGKDTIGRTPDAWLYLLRYKIIILQDAGVRVALRLSNYLFEASCSSSHGRCATAGTMCRDSYIALEPHRPVTAVLLYNCCIRQLNFIALAHQPAEPPPS